MRSLHKIGDAASRTVFVLALVLTLAIAANAYTVVTTGGRHLEIPAQFTVTGSTLTYEVSPGVQVTLLLAAINIPATEKANHEPPGSFLRRAGGGMARDGGTSRDAAAAAPMTVKPTAPGGPTVRRTITNLDLARTAQRRRQSEVAYEDRRKELGLPSVEESRRLAAAESESIARELEEQRAADSRTESYWRERAAALRTEMAAVDGQIAWIRARLDEGPAGSYAWNGWNGWNGWSSGSFTTVIGIAPFGNVRGGRFGHFGGGFGRGGFHAGRPARPGVFVAPNRGAQLSGRVPFGGGATRGQVLINPGFRPVGPNRLAGSFPIVAPGFGSVFGSVPAYDYSYERGDLITRFNELAGVRAGLNARWRELEEEARRAGASPGWLRP